MKGDWELEACNNRIFICRDNDYVTDKVIHDSDKLKFTLHYNRYNKLSCYQFDLVPGYTAFQQTGMSFFISYGHCDKPELSIVYEDKNLRLLSYSDSDYFIIKR